MDQLAQINSENIGEVLSALAKEDSFIAIVLLALIIVGLILMLIVKLIHMRVSKKLTKVAGMDGLDEEEKKERDFRTEQKKLEQKISDHDQAIRRNQGMQNLIRTLSGGRGQ